MNINSINTNYNNLYKTESLTQKSINRLSSAKKINSAADDAAGLAIVSGMTSQMNSLQVAQRNSSDGISATQTAGGSIQSMTDSLQRMRELAVQANNGTLSSSDRSALNQEFTLLNKSNDDIAKTSTFNNQKLLDGSYNSNIQTGVNPGNTTNINISDVTNTGDKQIK